MKVEKQTEDRYKRASVHWGTIAVHPTDLATLYSELSAARQAHVTNNKGTLRSRTTALAHIREGIEGLLSNGYYSSEVGTIIADQLSLISDGTSAQEQAEIDSFKEQVNAVVDEAIARLNALKG